MFEFLLNPVYQGWILQGLLLTIEITLFGVLLGLGLGTLLAIGDIYGKKPVKAAIAVYVEIFRGSPLFVQLLLAVYAVPTLLNIQIDHVAPSFLGFRTKQRRLPKRLHERGNRNHLRRSNAGGNIRRNVKNPDASTRDSATSLPNSHPILDKRVLLADKKHLNPCFRRHYGLNPGGTVNPDQQHAGSASLDTHRYYLLNLDYKLQQTHGYYLREKEDSWRRVDDAELSLQFLD